jgi:hypothetical protein
MSTHGTPGLPGGAPGNQGRRGGAPWRWLLRAAVVPAVLLLGGAALITRGMLGSGGGPHPQPLPARKFAIPPAAARVMPAPPRLARPQHGSIQAFCSRLPAGQPQVTIPSECVYAPLVPARVADGTLLIPPDVRQAGLDTSSAALTAARGTTIIAGHVDNYSQGDGVFYFLYQVQPGALITVTGPRHATTTWRAYKITVADKTTLPADIWSLTGPRRLVLVTCGGPIEHTPAGNTYADNVLIYATPATTTRRAKSSSTPPRPQQLPRHRGCPTGAAAAGALTTNGAHWAWRSCLGDRHRTRDERGNVHDHRVLHDPAGHRHRVRHGKGARPAGQDDPWAVASHFKAPPRMRCVLRGASSAS